MFRHPSNWQNASSDPEFSQPLLRSRSRSPDTQTVFAVDDNDNDDYDESTGVVTKNNDDRRSAHTVRFEDTVQVIAPPLRSTISSRETGVYVSICSVLHVFLRLVDAHFMQNMSSTRTILTTKPSGSSRVLLAADGMATRPCHCSSGSSIHLPPDVASTLQSHCHLQMGTRS